MASSVIRILLIEDNPAEVRLVQIALAETASGQFEPAHADTLAGGLQRLQQDACDAILLDLSLPDSAGLDTLRQVIRAKPDVPIVVLSGLHDVEVALEAVQSGAQDYLVKGRSDGELIARAVRYAIQRKQAELELRRARDELERRVAERTADLTAANEQLRREIEQRRQAEDRERQRLLEIAHVSRLSTMGELATEIAHEINQPLTAIAAYSDACAGLLRAGSWRQEDLATALENISAQARRAGEVIRRVRSYVRKEESRRAPADINEIVREVVHLARTEARWRNVAIQLDLAPALPPLLADRILIEQVILNLVRNAIEAMDAMAENGRTVTIQTAAGADATIEIVVRDTGPGLSPEIAGQIFAPFFTTKPQGMGMGLSISQSIVQAHGGCLRAGPNHPCGSVFRFSLPVHAEGAGRHGA